MGQSLSAIYIHAIFGTKNNSSFIDISIEKHLHSYMAGILKNLNSPAIKINSVPDHIHILFRMSKSHSISQIMHVIKRDSSKWMKTQGYRGFRWQIGYATYSVSQSKLETVSEYIVNQKMHHKKMSFLEEVESFMDKYNVDQYSRIFSGHKISSYLW